MKNIKFNLNFFFGFALLSIKIAISSPECMELMATSYFGVFNSCFNHAIESLKEIVVFYTQTGISGFSFGLLDGQNFSYVVTKLFTTSEIIYLTNSYLTGVEIWTGDNGITGLKFKIYSQNSSNYYFSSLMGTSIGCYSYLNSTFMRSKFFKINSIGGCVDNKISNEFPSLNFQYSFSQCPLFFLKSSTTTQTSTSSTTTQTSTSSTTTQTSTSSTTCPTGWVYTRLVLVYTIL